MPRALQTRAQRVRTNFLPSFLACAAVSMRRKAESKTEEERAGEGASNATGEGTSSDSTSGGGLFDEIRRQVHKESQSNESLKATLEELETTRCEKRRAAR